MCHIKEEPLEDCSDEHPVIEVKTEPYDTSILAGQDQMEHSHGSTSEGERGNTAMLPVEDTARGSSNVASSGCTPSNSRFKIGAATVETRFDNAAQITMNGRPMVQTPDQSKTEEAGKSSTFDHAKDSKCSVCLATCIDTDHSEVRLNTHGTKAFTCNVCSAAFRHPSTLRAHAKGNSGSYKCDLCPAEFSKSSCLRRHRRTHTGEKPYKCSLCPAEFCQSSNLQVHSRTHTGEKPYKCDLCRAQFRKSTNLQVHKRTHTGEKPYKCNVCPAEFSQSTSLHVHKRRHTGEKPCRCDLCPAKFSHRSSLQFHKRSQHEKKL
ncbi:zinc finger protein 112-like isoform X3 [Ornithodoros turicata]